MGCCVLLLASFALYFSCPPLLFFSPAHNTLLSPLCAAPPPLICFSFSSLLLTVYPFLYSCPSFFPPLLPEFSLYYSPALSCLLLSVFSGVVTDARVLFSSAGSHDTYLLPVCLLLKLQSSDSASTLFIPPTTSSSQQCFNAWILKSWWFMIQYHAYLF